jgi:hypothetical protein
MVLSLLSRMEPVLVDERARFTPPADDDHRYEGIALLCGGINRLRDMIAAGSPFKVSRRFDDATSSPQRGAVVRRGCCSRMPSFEVAEERGFAAIR